LAGSLHVGSAKLRLSQCTLGSFDPQALCMLRIGRRFCRALSRLRPQADAGPRAASCQKEAIIEMMRRRQPCCATRDEDRQPRRSAAAFVIDYGGGMSTPYLNTTVPPISLSVGRQPQADHEPLRGGTQHSGRGRGRRPRTSYIGLVWALCSQRHPKGHHRQAKRHRHGRTRPAVLMKSKTS
jgi:hypothetical protein